MKNRWSDKKMAITRRQKHFERSRLFLPSRLLVFVTGLMARQRKSEALGRSGFHPTESCSATGNSGSDLGVPPCLSFVRKVLPDLSADHNTHYSSLLSFLLSFYLSNIRIDEQCHHRLLCSPALALSC